MAKGRQEEVLTAPPLTVSLSKVLVCLVPLLNSSALGVYESSRQNPFKTKPFVSSKWLAALSELHWQGPSTPEAWQPVDPIGG